MLCEKATKKGIIKVVLNQSTIRRTDKKSAKTVLDGLTLRMS